MPFSSPFSGTNAKAYPVCKHKVPYNKNFVNKNIQPNCIMGIPDTYTMVLPKSEICTGLAQKVSYTQKQVAALPLVEEDIEMETIYETVKATNTKIFTPEEIKAATRNYSKENIIGKGGSSIVYKGILPSTQLIAVKRLSRSNSVPPFEAGWKDQLINEITALSQINNKNVVKLLGCCFETDVPSIVYEYIPNGTLADHLFDKQKACLLTWNRRLRIAIQVAQVVAYLHTTFRVPIIHRDIKPDNILLDNNYIPIVSDFGISKLVPDQYKEFRTTVKDTWETDGVITTSVMGTYGYAAPEYINTGRLSKKSDVYSFGVVLFELLVGQRFTKSAIFRKNAEAKKLVEILDKQLLREGSMEQMEKAALLAEWCLARKSGDRPSMWKVASKLQDIRGI